MRRTVNRTDDTALLTVPGLSVGVVVDRNEGDKVVVGAAATVDVVVVPAYVSVLAQVGLIVGPVASVHYALKKEKLFLLFKFFW
jgi:hypothetical protein